MHLGTRLTGLVAVTLAAACGAPKPQDVPSKVPASGVAASASERTAAVMGSSKVTLKLNPAWRACHEAFSVASGDVAAEVGRLAAACGEVTRMHRVAEPFRGEQAAAEKPQAFKWQARAGHCYRAYGVGAPAIKNLDVLMTDSRGVVIGQDGAGGGASVVPDAGGACFKEDDQAAVVVSVGDGKGAFAVEVWED
jgi:hypothetical protein